LGQIHQGQGRNCPLCNWVEGDEYRFAPPHNLGFVLLNLTEVLPLLKKIPVLKKTLYKFESLNNLLEGERDAKCPLYKFTRPPQ